MKTSIVRKGLMLGALGSSLLIGCAPNDTSDRPNHITAVRYNSETNEYIAERFIDKDHDGHIEFYVIGPSNRDDFSMPDPANERTKAFVSREIADSFFAEKGRNEEGIALRYNSIGGSVALGKTAEIMSEDMQNRIDTRYSALNSNPLTEEFVEGKREARIGGF